jgi:hypothetical protein
MSKKRKKSMQDDEEQEIDPREEHERQIAMMIVDALWQSSMIRSALQDKAYYNTGFDSGWRLSLGWIPPNEARPSPQSLYWELSRLVLDELPSIQGRIEAHPKKDKGTVTAADIYKPNRRRLVTYGLDAYEVSLAPGDIKVFPRTASGDIEYIEYLRTHGIDPKQVVDIGSA